jgi:hypothetical protein
LLPYLNYLQLVLAFFLLPVKRGREREKVVEVHSLGIIESLPVDSWIASFPRRKLASWMKRYFADVAIV